ncbi:hypothetical protein [Candidatus Tisiphia endosymbiont of Micropterix aruncella]|uniref:hypothetical protein n=1 Tax=Candidatus Tisiphia endosymbiont of Micropterix aruncella TaxID=3066271 RepID=UPI003AA81996
MLKNINNTVNKVLTAGVAFVGTAAAVAFNTTLNYVNEVSSNNSTIDAETDPDELAKDIVNACKNGFTPECKQAIFIPLVIAVVGAGLTAVAVGKKKILKYISDWANTGEEAEVPHKIDTPDFPTVKYQPTAQDEHKVELAGISSLTEHVICNEGGPEVI